VRSGLIVIAVAAALAATAPPVPAGAVARPVAGPLAAPPFGSPGGVGAPAPVAAPPSPAALAADSYPRDVRAPEAALTDSTTGMRLWSRKLNVRRPIGSIVKVMTALVVLREGHLNQPITVTRAAIRYVRKDGASSAGLMAGDVLTARQLLEAMLLPSGCDAAYLLATAYGPGRPAFLRKMNAQAAALGMTSTRFTSFDGMPYPKEWSTYSTPADLIRLGAAAMREPAFRSIVIQRHHYLAKTRQHRRYAWSTTNLMLGSYRGMLGIKTGDTTAAGDCFLFAARKDGTTLIGVVLHASPTYSYTSRFVAATRILDWGFRRLKLDSAFGGRLLAPPG
jgi:D-alanyl-D-alanine carboxypeptidase (penicillin-binding protein 5/6)